MTLFELLSHDEKLIVLSNEGDETLFTWNRAHTLQFWKQSNYDEWGQYDPSWNEVSCRTLSEEPTSYDEARKQAMMWQGEMWSE